MDSSITRPLEPDELSAIEKVLLRLRQHFHQWPGHEGFEHDLVGFAFYEGCGGSDHCGRILAEAAPLALGEELVTRHGFTWAAVHHGDEWHFAVTHPSLTAPIDLVTLEDGRYDGETNNEPPAPGEATYRSLEAILNKIGRCRRKDA